MDGMTNIFQIALAYAGLSALSAWLVMLGVGDLHSSLSGVPALGFLTIWFIFFGLTWLPYLSHSND